MVEFMHTVLQFEHFIRGALPPKILGHLADGLVISS